MSHHEGGHNRASDAAADVVRRFVDTLNTGDMQAGADLLADDIEWHEIGRAEPTRGKAALAARFQQPDAAAWDISGEVHDILAGDDHVVSLVTATARKGDESLTYRVAEVYHVRDGQITGRWAMSDDTEAINRFFGS
jgi:ketosteroid isomerase-like protein